MFTLRIQPKQILLLLIMGLLIFLSFLFVSVLKKKNLSIVSGSIGGKADVKIGQFSFVQIEEGARYWELKADRAELFEKDHKAFLEKIAVTIQTPEGRELKLNGDEGVVDTLQKNFSLKKKNELMTVELNDGYIIKTSSLKWLNDQKIIVTEGPASVFGPEIEIHGRELKIAVDNQEVTVSGNVEASVY